MPIRPARRRRWRAFDETSTEADLEAITALFGAKPGTVEAGSMPGKPRGKQFLTQFEQIRVLMRKMMSMSVWERIKMVTGLGQQGAFDPGSKLLKGMTKGDTGHRKTAKERAEERKKKRKKK